MPETKQDEVAEAPYCDVCGASGADLRTAVEVCRDCYDVASMLPEDAIYRRLDELGVSPEQAADGVRRVARPDARCVTIPDGGCVGIGCMHDLRDELRAEQERTVA